MNVLSNEALIANEERLSRPEAGEDGSLYYRAVQRQRARAMDLHRQQMRWIGVGLCVASAMITLASAMLIAVRF